MSQDTIVIHLDTTDTLLTMNPLLKVYIAHPISGSSYDQVTDRYQDVVEKLQQMGYIVYRPLTGKGYLRDEIELKLRGYHQPASTDQAIVRRDFWRVSQSDIVFADLSGATRVSIGAMMEMAVARCQGKHVVLVIEEELNPHHHAFVRQCADIFFTDHKEAMTYLEKLIGGEV